MVINIPAGNYTIPQVQNITSALTIGNEVLGNYMFGNLLLATIFIIIFINLSSGENSSVGGSAVFAALVSFIVNILLIPLNVVTHLSIPIFLAIMIGGFFIPNR